MLGPICNSLGIVVGGSCGALIGDRIAAPFRMRMTDMFGLASMGLGIAVIPKVNSLPAVIIAMILGTICGELLHLEAAVTKLADRAQSLLGKLAMTGSRATSPEEFLHQFVALIVLYSASGTGVFGAINEGITGSSSMLMVKTFLDMGSAVFFASVLGFPVALIAIPQFAIQGSLYACANLISPLTNPSMIADFSACGGLIMLANGLRIVRIKHFSVVNMLPAMALAMPVSALWSRLPLH